MIYDPDGNFVDAETFKNILVNNPYLNITLNAFIISLKTEIIKCIGIRNYTMFFLSSDKTMCILDISNLSTEGQHLDYSLTKYNLVDEDSVLVKTNTTPFTPTEDYHPATKKYVYDLAGGDIEKIVIQYIRDENIATAHLLTLYRKGNDGSQDFETFPKNELFAYFNKGIPCFVQDNVGSRFKITSITNHINPQVTVLYHGSIETFEITTESDYFGTNAYNIRTLSFIVFNEIKSSDIRTMNGYSLRNDKSAIKSSDSLNEAISKLEYRIKALEEKYTAG